MTMRMYQALEDVGVPVDLHLYPGQDRSLDAGPVFSQAIVDATGLLISRYDSVNTSARPGQYGR